jgi:hypothetical protein
MPNVEPHRLPATTLVRLIESGELSAQAVVRSCLERIAEREPVVRAWSHLSGEAALAAAREIDRTKRDTLLKGVPFGIKDIFDTADMPTTYGSPIYVGCRPIGDASAAALPRAAGGVLLGKTVTTEFANRHPGPTTNPHNPDFSPGGSSSGSAAAVADFMVPLAIGTQTGGSVIRPAAYCGVVGFKPSFGLFPPAGMRINTEALDTVGILTRSVGDIALFRAAMMAIPYSPPAMPEAGPRLGLCRTKRSRMGERCSKRRPSGWPPRALWSATPRCHRDQPTVTRGSASSEHSRGCAITCPSSTGTKPCSARGCARKRSHSAASSRSISSAPPAAMRKGRGLRHKIGRRASTRSSPCRRRARPRAVSPIPARRHLTRCGRSFTCPA